MEKITRNETGISIILSIHHPAEINLSAYEGLFALVNKAKTDIECLILDNASTENLSQKLTPVKSCQELLAKGKIKLLRSDKKISLSDAYSRCIAVATGAYTIFIEDPAKVNIGNLIVWFNSNKKTISKDGLYSGSLSMGNAGVKNAGSEKWKRTIYNACIRFFTASKLSDHTSGVLISQTETAAYLFDSKLTSANSILDILCFAAYDDMEVKEFPVNSEKKLKAPGIAAIVAVPLNVWSIKWGWFVRSAISSMRKPGNDLSEGNHPLYRLSFYFISLFLLFFLPWLSFDFGISWDSKLHNQYGYEMLKYFDTDGKDTTCFTSHRDYPFYGEHINVISAYINKSELSPWGEYETRHVINAIYGFFAMLFCGLAAREIGTWRTGVLGISFIALTPVFLAHSMNNPTDIPLATGFSIGTFYILRAMKQMPKPKFSVLFGIAVGIGVAIGSRIAGLLLIGYFGLFTGILWLIQTNKNGFSKSVKLIWPYAKAVLIAAAIGYALGLSLWPYGQHRPFANPLQAITRTSANAFFAYNVELFEGHRLYMIYAPWYYVIKFIGITTPLYILTGFFISILGIRWIMKKYPKGLYLIVIFTLVFPLIYAEFKNVNHYNGWRHYLFIYSPIVVLSALGWDFLLQLFKKKILQVGIVVLLLVAMVKPVYWIIKNHPNECVYFNELVGGLRGAYGTYETDYYSNSCRAAGEWIAKQEPSKKLLVAVNNEPLTASYFANKINPNLQFMWVREYEEQRPMWDYLILTSRTFSRNELLNGSFPPKGTVYTVAADGVPLAVVVKRENYFMPLGYKTYDAKNFDSAVYYFTQAMKYDPKDEEASRMLGQAYLNKGSLDTAEKYLDRALEIFPENYSALSNKGLVYLNKKEYAKALTFFKKAIEQKRNLTEAYYYASVCEFSRNNYEGAIPYLESAIKNNGQAPEVYYNLGIAYLNTGRYSKAEQAFLGALGMNPKMPNAYFALAETYRKLDKPQEANICVQKYHELGGQ